MYQRGDLSVNSLQKKILTDGKVLPGNILKVDGFLNHQIDINLIHPYLYITLMSF